MAQTWLIGSAADCDLVVDHQSVSARHCRLTAVGSGQYLLEDLVSTNGTFVEGERVTAARQVSRNHRVTLGRSQPMPWPDEREAASTPDSATGELRIGRELDNDFVVSLPTVSGYHARLIWSGRSGDAVIEDLGSSNGTAVGSPDRQSVRAALKRDDTVFLGSHPIPAERLFEALEAKAATDSIATGASVPGPKRAAARRPAQEREWEGNGSIFVQEWKETWGSGWNSWLFLGLGLSVGLLAFATAGFDPRALSGDSAGWVNETRGLATALARLGAGAVVVGLLIGVRAGTRTPRVGGRRGLARAVAAAVVGATACLLEWAVFRVAAGGAVETLGALGLLGLGAGVGLALGFIAASVSPRPAAAWALAAALILPLWTLGGESTVWRRLPGWARTAAGASPSRWTFEGLLLIAAERVPVPTAGAVGWSGDLAEPEFPVETERNGPFAAMLALGAMLLGWGAAAVFIARETLPPAPAEPPSP